MVSAWAVLGIQKTIPGLEIFANSPKMPTVIDKTDGAVSDANAQAIIAALWRESALIQWAEAHDEPDFIANALL